MDINFKITSPGARLPRYKTKGASGADVGVVHGPVTIPPKQIMAIATYIELCDMPKGYEIQVRGRSSSFKKGLLVFPGTVDEDFRGEIQILVQNVTLKPITIEEGEDIAQLVVAEVTRADFGHSELKIETERGTGGFGSTDLILGDH